MNTTHRTKNRRRATMVALAMLAMTASGCASPATSAAGPAWKDGHVLIPVRNGTASIDPATLQVDFHVGNRTDSWSAASPTTLGKPTPPVVVRNSVRWGFEGSDLTVIAAAESGRLSVDIESPTDRALSWPVTGGRAAASVEFPNGEGQTIPTDDPFWLSPQAGLDGSSWDFAGGLTMPFWGATLPNGGVSYIVHDDIGTTLNFDVDDSRMHATAEHTFSAARATDEYKIFFAPTDGNPVAAGQDYRQYLSDTSGIVSLDEKIAANPDTASLIGALHAYTWGDGRDASIVTRLQDLGIQNAWLGYDGTPMTADSVAAAQAAGYLVGPYDTWSNAQDPADSDTASSIWPGSLWPAGCVTDTAGNPVSGFSGRGCYLSTAALDAAQADGGVLNQRVQAFVQNGASSYFLDVDAVGQLFRDYSPAHPQTEAEDRASRLARLEALASGTFSNGSPLVVGSETAAAWSNPAVSYSHGSSTPLTDGIWALQQDKETWGGYWPEDRPGFFFGQTQLPEPIAEAMFDPTYRVPLYETVLHDSVISTDRWEMGLYRFPDLVHERTLTNLLYNTPAIIALDSRTLDDHGPELARMQQFFAQLQRAGGTEPMTSFEHVDQDVQRTTFGDALTITVNFGAEDRAGVAAGCALAIINGNEETFCTAG